jgi:hypothetical protein
MILSNATCQPAVCHALLNLYIEVVPDTTTNGTITRLYPPQSRCPTAPPPNPFPTGTPRKERALSLLIEAFSGSATLGTQKIERKANLHFLATVFANISSVGTQTRHWFYTQEIPATRRSRVSPLPPCDVISFGKYGYRSGFGLTNTVHRAPGHNTERRRWLRDEVSHPMGELVYNLTHFFQELRVRSRGSQSVFVIGGRVKHTIFYH